MLVFAEHITPRLQYIIDFMGTAISTEEWVLTCDEIQFCSAPGAKVNYSARPLQTHCIQVLPQGLLFETGTRKIDITVEQRGESVVFFQQPGEPGFDIFAACFYLLSRYEEYLPHQTDKHGRYAHQNALAFKAGFLHKPMINTWLAAFKAMLQKTFGPAFKTKDAALLFVPTYDIDMARSYRYKGFLVNAGNILRDALRFRFGNIGERCRVLAGRTQDPYDTFGWLNHLHEQYKVHPYYFFLVAAKKSAYDKNIAANHPVMKQLIADTCIRYPVGLHPSWQSGDVTNLLEQEKNTLSALTGTSINASRQHYLRFTLPQTYRRLIDAGILFDFSMGYAGYNGFRASVASPFKWFDLEKEVTTSLTLFPFCFMEATSIYYKNDTAAQALEELKALYTEVEKVKGFFSMIWHNSSFCEKNEFAGWRDTYEQFLKYVKDR